MHLYEELGLLEPAMRSEGGFRLYGHDAVTRINWIVKLQAIGFTLSEIQGFIRDFHLAHTGKDATTRVLKEGSQDLPGGELSELVTEPPGYIAIMGYLPYSGETEAAIARLRTALIERFHVATTWGYGPRFLHSTGQFHKGGPKVGRFLQLIDEPAADVEIPGEPYTFATLIRAQADGDLQTLRDHGLQAVRVVVGDIDEIKERI